MLRTVGRAVIVAVKVPTVGDTYRFATRIFAPQIVKHTVKMAVIANKEVANVSNKFSGKMNKILLETKQMKYISNVN